MGDRDKLRVLLAGSGCGRRRRGEEISSGSTAASVGIVDASEDVEIAGPQALTSDADGNLFILDQVNGRILRFNPKQSGDQASILKMPATIQPSDLVVSKSDILVWDGSVRTLKPTDQPSTRGLDGGAVQLEEVSTRGVDDRFATSAFAQMGSQPPGSATDLLDQSTRDVVIKKRGNPIANISHPVAKARSSLTSFPTKARAAFGSKFEPWRPTRRLRHLLCGYPTN